MKRGKKWIKERKKKQTGKTLKSDLTKISGGMEPITRHHSVISHEYERRSGEFSTERQNREILRGRTALRGERKIITKDVFQKDDEELDHTLNGDIKFSPPKELKRNLLRDKPSLLEKITSFFKKSPSEVTTQERFKSTEDLKEILKGEPKQKDRTIYRILKKIGFMKKTRADEIKELLEERENHLKDLNERKPHTVGEGDAQRNRAESYVSGSNQSLKKQKFMAILDAYYKENYGGLAELYQATSYNKNKEIAGIIQHELIKRGALNGMTDHSYKCNNVMKFLNINDFIDNKREGLFKYRNKEHGDIELRKILGPRALRRLLHTSIENGNDKEVGFWLKHGAKVSNEYQDISEPTVFHLPYISGTEDSANKVSREKILDLLMKKGAKLTATRGSQYTGNKLGDIEGDTIMHGAVRHERTDLVKFLLNAIKSQVSKGQFLNKRNVVSSDAKGNDIGGETALDIAVKAGNLELTKLLLENGADPSNTARNRESTLGLAVSKGRVELAKLLLEKMDLTGLNQRNEEKSSPLDIAVEKGNLKLTTLLLDKVRQLARKETKSGRYKTKEEIINKAGSKINNNNNIQQNKQAFLHEFKKVGFFQR